MAAATVDGLSHLRRIGSLELQSLAEALQVEEQILDGLIALLAILSQRFPDDAFQLRR